MRSVSSDSVSVSDSSFGEVVGTHFYGDLVTWEYPNEELPHLSTHVCEQFLAVLQTNLEFRIGQGFYDFRIQCDLFFFRHQARLPVLSSSFGMRALLRSTQGIGGDPVRISAPCGLTATVCSK